MVVVVVVWYLDTCQGNKTNSKYISARRLTNHFLIMKTEFSPNNLPVKSPPPRQQRGLTFSPKSAARPENEEIESSLELQRDIKRTFSLCQTRQVKGNPTRERGVRSHARRNFTANLTPTDKANELVTRREERPGNHSSLPP